MSGNRNREIPFDNHLKTCANSNDNILSTKVKSGSVMVEIAEKKNLKKKPENPS